MMKLDELSKYTKQKKYILRGVYNIMYTVFMYI